MTPGGEARLPRALRPGARIALVAPAGPLDRERVDASEMRCRSLGLKPVVSPSVEARRGYLAGSDDHRLADLQSAFDDPSIDAVWALRGGYGTTRIVDRLDLARQLRDPIPFIGFSDNTTLHARHRALGVVSFHGPHPGEAFPPETEASFRSVLFGSVPPGPLPVRLGDPEPRTLVPGEARGPLVGGNLAMVASLCGTRDQIPAGGCILFLEDVGEPAYRVDRLLLQLLRAGVLKGVLGLALGRFTGAEDEEGVAGVVTEYAERVGVPAVADLPFGHVEHNCTLPVGSDATLDGNTAVLRLTEPAVAGPALLA